jgi:replicative DNA helicase
MKFDNEQIELRVLKHMITNPLAINKILEQRITDSHFGFIPEQHTRSYTNSLFKLIQVYYEQNGTLTTKNILETRLAKSSKVDAKEKMKYLEIWEQIELEDCDDNELPFLIEELKEKRCWGLWNDMHQVGHEAAVNESLEAGIAASQAVIDQIHEELADFGSEKQRIDVSMASDFVKEEYNRRLNDPASYQGVRCGIENIDEKTFGWMGGQLVVLLAPSSGGKSVQLLNWAHHAHKEQQKNVLYFSFEMDLWQCLLRHLSLAYQVPYSALKGMSLAPQEVEDLVTRLSLSKGGAYFEYDVSLEDPTPEYVDSRIRELIQTKGKPDLVVIDYMGNMKTRDGRREAKPWEQQGDAFQKLHVLAKRYQLPFLTAQQINRESIRENRKRKEDKKATQYWQDAASGDQRLMHLAHFVIGLEPHKEESMVTYHPVKMRDAWFVPTGAKWDAEHNGVYDLTPEEHANWMRIARLNGTMPDDGVGVQQGTTVRELENGNQEISWQGGVEVVDASELTLDPSDWDME